MRERRWGRAWWQIGVPSARLKRTAMRLRFDQGSSLVWSSETATIFLIVSGPLPSSMAPLTGSAISPSRIVAKPSFSVVK